MNWRIEYDNDTGPNDEGFSEWWTVTNDEQSFTTDSEAEAQWLLATLSPDEWTWRSNIRDIRDLVQQYGEECSCVTYNGWFRTKDPKVLLGEIEKKLDDLYPAAFAAEAKRWEQVAKAQDAKVRAMMDQPGGLERLKKVLADARPSPWEASLLLDRVDQALRAAWDRRELPADVIPADLAQEIKKHLDEVRA